LDVKEPNFVKNDNLDFLQLSHVQPCCKKNLFAGDSFLE